MNRTGERQHFGHFVAQVPELAGATIDQDGESPDFLIVLPDRRIGVELTEYFHGKAPRGTIGQRERETFERQVVAEAQRTFESHDGPPLHVSVGWYGRVVTERRELVARAIADVVADRLPEVPATDTYIQITLENEELPELLQPWVAFIGILRTARGTAHFWTVPQAGYIEADAHGVGAVIVDKETDIPSYRPCDEYWLLIYASGDSISSTMMPAESATDQDYTTAFDRVYVLDSVDRVYRLKTSTTR